MANSIKTTWRLIIHYNVSRYRIFRWFLYWKTEFWNWSPIHFRKFEARADLYVRALCSKSRCLCVIFQILFFRRGITCRCGKAKNSYAKSLDHDEIPLKWFILFLSLWLLNAAAQAHRKVPNRLLCYRIEAQHLQIDQPEKVNPSEEVIFDTEVSQMFLHSLQSRLYILSFYTENIVILYTWQGSQAQNQHRSNKRVDSLDAHVLILFDWVSLLFRYETPTPKLDPKICDRMSIQN